MTRVVGVRFKHNGRIYYFDPGELDIQAGDGVIVETARGTEFGDVSQPPAEVPDEQVVQPLKPVLRVATEADRAMRDENAAREGEAFAVCQRKIAQHKLDMKLVDVEYTFNGSKVIFYFTADERVDFRELVKDLAGHFKTRIELRQIGVRDEARMLGGLGSCGRPVCCKTFLDDFRPVSIKMAKEQNLSLSPTKISGLCGRLMCCLQYEQAAYEEMKKLMPKTGKEIQTPDGNGIAVENNAITERTKVKLTLPDGTFDLRWYHYTELAKVGDPPPKPRETPVPADGEALSAPRPAAPRKPRSRKSAPAASAAQGAQPGAQPAGEGAAAPRPKRSRSRRKPAGGQGDQPAAKAPEAAATAGTDRPRRRPPRKPGAGQAQGAAAGAPAAQAPQAAEGAAPATKPRRRRRGGAGRNRPKPEGGAPSAE